MHGTPLAEVKLKSQLNATSLVDWLARVVRTALIRQTAPGAIEKGDLYFGELTTYSRKELTAVALVKTIIPTVPMERSMTRHFKAWLSR